MTKGTSDAAITSWADGNLGGGNAPFVEDSDGDTIYARVNLGPGPLAGPPFNVQMTVYSVDTSDSAREFFYPAAVPCEVGHVTEEDPGLWWARARVPRSLGAQALVVFTAYAP